MKISKMPHTERPREKLLQLGASALTDAELLAIFLRTGLAGCNAIELAQGLLNQAQSLSQLLNSSEREFCQLKGVGVAKYVQLQAVIELSRRYLAEECIRSDYFDSPDAVTAYLTSHLKAEQREAFMVLFLDAQHRLISDEILFKGTINAANVYPREVVKAVLKYNAVAVILAHNHPSGVAEPSQADRLITEKLSRALDLIDVKVLDHIVIAGAQSVSFANRGWL